MRKPRGLILGLVGMVLAGVSLAGAVFVYGALRLPEPEQADLRGLLRWLVTRDLSVETESLQDRLLSRLEQELRGGIQLGEARNQLSDSQREQLLRNADLMGRRWFFKQVNTYFATADTERPTFLDRQIDEIQKSGILDALGQLVAIDGPANKTGASKSAWAGLLDRIHDWKSSAPPLEQQQADQFVTAVQKNLFYRMMRGMFSKSA